MLLLVLLVLVIALIVIGMVSYRYLFGLHWVDAFYSATLILTTISSDVRPKTNTQKIFVAFYALFSALVFIAFASAIYGQLIIFSGAKDRL